MIPIRNPYGKIFLLFALNTIACAQDQVGDECTTNNGVVGVCKFLSECPRAEEDAKSGISPSICRFYGQNGLIVCCENNNRRQQQFQQEQQGHQQYQQEQQGQHQQNHQELQEQKQQYQQEQQQYQQQQQQQQHHHHQQQQQSDRTTTNKRNEDSGDFFYPDEIPVTNRRNNKSEKKCEDYSNSTVDVVQAIALTPQSDPVTISVVKCNFNGLPLIVGGTPAVAGEFPFMAAIGFQLNEEVLWKCGGTLISERYVLTAAHCTTSRDAGAPVLVRLGELDLSQNEDGAEPEDYDIDRIIVHPDYRYPQKYNDIALLKLKRTVRFTKFITPACLYTKDNIPQRKALATGWGKTDYLAANTNNILLKVELNVFNNDQCSRTYKQTKYLPDGIKSTMLCAGELKGGKDTCQGDSGGPLFLTKEDNNCVFYIIGVTSFGKYCGATNIPAVYTRISSYIPWIENIVW